MIHKLKAVVLHSIKYKESSSIIYLYTNGFGRQTYLINGARSGKNKAKSNLFHPLFLLDVEAYHNPKSDIQRIKECQLSIPLQNVPFSLTKSSLALFISELLYKVVREEEANLELFDFIYHSILMLDELEEGVPNFHLHFLAQLSKYLGFYPNRTKQEDSAYFDIKTGEFCVLRPRHPLFFSTENTVLLSRLIELSASQLFQLELNRHQRQSFLNSMMEFYGFHFENLSQLRSLLVLNEVFE
ncbi:MAG: DNA repair protein RecO [Prevotellaceae bacterium]|jgi:DNA repair protein RecO (recombination protein O)|nr:DNA repair protein RecO [Prevotellaceae bacterium]